MFKRACTLTLAAGLLAVGCNQTSTEGSTQIATRTNSATTTPAPATGGNLHKLASGLQYEDVIVGSGKMAELGMNVSVNYTGWLVDPNSPFDSSVGKEPIKFQMGTPGIISGWNEGIKGMRIGGKRRLTIPPDMAYGAAGRAPLIPPNATLKFDVELVDVQ